jgi:hypothetical protein
LVGTKTTPSWWTIFPTLAFCVSVLSKYVPVSLSSMLNNHKGRGNSSYVGQPESSKADTGSHHIDNNSYSLITNHQHTIIKY